MIAVVVALIAATTPGFAGQDEGGQIDPEKEALIGGMVGLAAGFAASAIYSGTTQQCDNDVYEHTLARCGLPIAGMVIGGAFAGHFIGRLADKSRGGAAVAQSRRSRMEAIDSARADGEGAAANTLRSSASRA